MTLYLKFVSYCRPKYRPPPPTYTRVNTLLVKGLKKSVKSYSQIPSSITIEFVMDWNCQKVYRKYQENSNSISQDTSLSICPKCSNFHNDLTLSGFTIFLIDPWILYERFFRVKVLCATFLYVHYEFAFLVKK